eukprot:366232-Chlamydomonas_euryale.AAC.8
MSDWLDEWMDEWTDRQMGAWMDGAKTQKCVLDVHLDVYVGKGCAFAHAERAGEEWAAHAR